MRPLLALLTLSACAPALRVVRSENPPLREALAADAPATLHRVLGVDLWVHDSGASASTPPAPCTAIPHQLPQGDVGPNAGLRRPSSASEHVGAPIARVDQRAFELTVAPAKRDRKSVV